MKKLTILEIEAAVKNARPDLIKQIRDLSHKMKDCRKDIVYNKKMLEQSNSQFNKLLNYYSEYVSGKSLQDVEVLTYIKRRINEYEQYIFENREHIRKLNKSLYELRQQNNELFKKLLRMAIHKTIDFIHPTVDDQPIQQNKKIVLNSCQARQVFNKLYDLLESGEDFERVNISID